jgi:hypothetical protein
MPTKDGQGIFYGWVVLGVAFVTVVLGYAIRNSFAVFYPTIVDEFSWGRGSTALMFSISFLPRLLLNFGFVNCRRRADVAHCPR